MVNLLKTVKKEKIVEVDSAEVNEEALKEIAIELLKGNHKTRSWEVNRDFYSTETEVELVVGEGYEITIKNNI